jgi:peptide/nickel transport system permease protein
MVVRLIPGGAETAVLGENATPQAATQLRHSLGLDRPIPEQYVRWLGGVLHGDFGQSIQFKRPVSKDLRERIPVTMELGLLAMVVSLCIALPIGALSAMRQDTAIDYGARAVAIAMLSLPNFWLGTLVLTFGSVWFNWAPPLTYHSLTDAPLKNLAILAAPAIILGAALSGTVMRLTRAQMLEVLRQDYVRTAWAKGLRERTVVTRHAVRNAFIPVITVIGLQVPILIGGTVILETIFSVPGMGRFLVGAIGARDYPVIQGINLMVALIAITTNLVVDLSYSLIDPRVKYA